jgi:heat shock protein HslJ
LKPRIFSVSVLFAVCSVAGCSSGHKPAEPKKVSSPVTISLLGSEWILHDLADTPALPNITATLAFPEAGRAAGNGSCNRFTGSVEISGSTIKFGPLASTRMACIDNAVSSQEATYLKALVAATRYEWQDPYLLIFCDGFPKPLRFTPAPTTH